MPILESMGSARLEQKTVIDLRTAFRNAAGVQVDLVNDAPYEIQNRGSFSIYLTDRIETEEDPTIQEEISILLKSGESASMEPKALHKYHAWCFKGSSRLVAYKIS